LVCFVRDPFDNGIWVCVSKHMHGWEGMKQISEGAEFDNQYSHNKELLLRDGYFFGNVQAKITDMFQVTNEVEI